MDYGIVIYSYMASLNSATRKHDYQYTGTH